MTIDWFSFSLGVAAGLLFMNLLAIITAYIKRQKAHDALKATTEKIKAFEAELEGKKQEILKKIKEERK
jgi:uncharacterized membrane protein